MPAQAQLPLKNPGFELGTNSWTWSGTAALVTNAAPPLGLNCGELRLAGSGIVQRSVPVIPGQNYTHSVWLNPVHVGTNPLASRFVILDLSQKYPGTNRWSSGLMRVYNTGWQQFVFNIQFSTNGPALADYFIRGDCMQVDHP